MVAPALARHCPGWEIQFLPRDVASRRGENLMRRASPAVARSAASSPARATFAVFRVLEGAELPGLDWTVPVFLFTLLIAVGEDDNILVTRIDEARSRA